MPPGTNLEVTAARSPSFEYPIALKRGDRVLVGRRDADWPEFLWCTGPDGRQGWVPETYLETNGATAVASRDYDAAELAVRAGERVRGHHAVGGWVWCVNERGRAGWVPETHLSPVEESNTDPLENRSSSKEA